MANELTQQNVDRCIEIAEEIIAMSDATDDFANSVCGLIVIVTQTLFALCHDEHYDAVLEELRRGVRDELDEAEAAYADAEDAREDTLQ